MSSSSDVRNPVEELAEEFVTRRRRGEKPTLQEYCDRYPHLADEIRDLFPALGMVEDLGNSSLGASASETEADGVAKKLHRIGDYRILREVGRGGMGVVYEAEQESLGRRVALKLLPPHALLDARQVARFEREARAAARLHHTNIVPVIGVGHHEGAHFYVMQFIQGQGLDEVITELRRRRRGEPATNGATLDVTTLTCSQAGRVAQSLVTGVFRPAAAEDPPLAAAQPLTDSSASNASSCDSSSARLPEGPEMSTSSGSEQQYYRSVARIGWQVAQALDYAHGQGVLHRDVKPSNLLLDLKGTVWVTDFGLAKAGDAADLTHTGDVVGTIRYMAPERFQGQSDARADVYALGVTLYELLALRPAFAERDRLKLMRQVTHEDPPRLRKLNAHVPRDLETVVHKTMAKDPAERYASAKTLADDLQRFLEDRPIQARRAGLAERVWRWCRRNPAVAVLAAALTLMLLASAGGSFVAALWLGAERDEAVTARDALEAQHQATLAERERAERAERQVRESRWGDYLGKLGKAQAARWSNRAGQRFESLQALTEAAQVGRDLQMPEQRIVELRNEVIGCLTLTDVRLHRQWDVSLLSPTCAAFDPALERYAVSDGQGVIRVCRSADERELFRLQGPKAQGWELRFCPHGRFLAAKHHPAGQDQAGVFVVWRLEQRAVLLRVPFLVSALDFSPDSRWLAMADMRGVIHLYDLQADPPQAQSLPAGPVAYHVAFHPEGAKLAVSCAQPPLAQIRDLEGRVLANLHHPKGVRGVAWHPHGRLLASACADGHVYVWDTDEPRQPIRVLRGHQGVVITVAFSHQGDLLASRSWDGTTRLWDPLGGRELVSTSGALYGFSPDDKLLAFSLGSKVGLWQVAPGRECRSLYAHREVGYGPWTANFHPDGRLLASAHDDGARLWDRRNGKEIALLPVGPGQSALVHPADGSLLTYGPAGLCRWPLRFDPKQEILEVAVGQPQRLLGKSVSTGYVLSLSPDGTKLALPMGAQCGVLDVGTGQVLWRGPQGNVNRALFSPDGRWVASSTWLDKGVKVWNARSGECVQDLADTDQAQIAFSPDSRWLVTSTQREYCFWSVGSWEPAKRMPQESGRSGYLAFSGDGKLLAINPARGLVRLVDPATGRELATLPTDMPLSFSADGSCLVTRPANQVLQLWDLRAIRQQLAPLGLDWSG